MKIIKAIKSSLVLVLAVISFGAYGQSNNFKVTLDAGHGGHDDGAKYNGHIEKNTALAVVLKVGKILEESPGNDVIYTRKTDVFIDLIERANIANRADANIFVSIHCNANKNTLADGTEAYVMGMTKVASNLAAAKSENEVVILENNYKLKYEGFDPNSPETMIGMTLMQEEYLENSISLASKVEEAFGSLGKKIRGEGVKQAPFMVLHKAYMPRVLIEMGFISNKEEGDILDSEEGQNEIAKGIANAIISYKKEYFETGTIETTEEKPSQKIIEKLEKNDTNVVKSVTVSDSSISNTAVPKKDVSGTLFKVQLSASTKKLALVPKNFKGLKNVSMAFDNRVYKYMYEETSDYNEAKKHLQEAKAKGYSTAFLIAFKDGEKISVRDAIKL